MASSMTLPPRIAVIGGGIGGLAAALALLQRGFDVDVYQHSLELRGVGAGIAVSSNATRVLDALGLQEALARVQGVSARREIRPWKTGETWIWFDLGDLPIQRYGSRHMYLHRGDLHRILVDAVQSLKADAIKLGKRCIAVTQSGEDVEVRFEADDVAHAALVVGADGIHSRVRECLFGADTPKFTGCVACRGLVPMERLRPHISAMVGT